MEQLKHECGVAMIRLLKPLDYFEKNGMKCVGINPAANLVEIVEIPEKKWYIGTQFHPEYSSTVLNPHPLFMSFIQACK